MKTTSKINLMVSALAAIALGCVIGCDQRASDLTLADEPMFSAPAPSERSITYTIPEWGVRFGSVQSIENYPIWTTNAANKVYALATGINNMLDGYVATNHRGKVRIQGPVVIGSKTDGADANGAYSLAIGAAQTTAGAFSSLALGYSVASNVFSFVHAGTERQYGSHGTGTFNVNPNGGLSGFWIGETNLQQIIRMEARAMIAEAVADIDTNIQSAEDARVALTNLITILKNL